jgi:hypothetical protein
MVNGETLRTFTLGECNQLGGTYGGNGECLKKEGGSWSWDCRNEANVMATGGSLISGIAEQLSGGSSVMMIPAWCWAAGAVVGVVAWRMLRK